MHIKDELCFDKGFHKFVCDRVYVHVYIACMHVCMYVYVCFSNTENDKERFKKIKMERKKWGGMGRGGGGSISFKACDTSSYQASKV